MLYFRVLKCTNVEALSLLKGLFLCRSSFYCVVCRVLKIKM